MAARIVQEAIEMANMSKIDGYFMVAWDKKGGHVLSFSLGDGVIRPTLLPSWLGDVARRHSLTPAAIKDMQENDDA